MKNDLNKQTIIYSILIFIICIVSFFYRAIFLNIAFWYDEACSWAGALNSFPKGIMDYLVNIDLQHTPIYLFILHFWMKLFGTSEYAIRFLSFLFSIACFPLVYTISKRLSSKFFSIITLAIFGMSPILVYFATEARMYPVVTFFVLLSLNFFLDVVEEKPNSKLKLFLTNLLIPYTLVGGIFYNISFAVFAVPFYYKKNKEDFPEYLRYVIYEWIFLIPYFILVAYYASQRASFLIRHEGALYFNHVVDLIRNFFSVITAKNLYMPDVAPVVLNASFFIFIVLPCVYFIYGYISGLKNSDGILKLLYKIVLCNFFLFVLCTYFQVCVCTTRYIIYILPITLILSVIGLSKKISKVHLIIFAAFFAISAGYYNHQLQEIESVLKINSFKIVRLEADKIGLGPQDLVVMPFGSDAPYYFRQKGSPSVLNFDFHKELRNINNPRYYSREQQIKLASNDKYKMLYEYVTADKPFSEIFAKNFSEVLSKIPSGHYVLIAFYSDDAQAIITFEDLKKIAKDVDTVKKDVLSFVLAKYTYDLLFLLNSDFEFMGRNVVDTYTFLLYKKK